LFSTIPTLRVGIVQTKTQLWSSSLCHSLHRHTIFHLLLCNRQMRILSFCFIILFLSCKETNFIGDSNPAKYSKLESSVFEQEVSKYRFNNGDTIVDIGAGSGINVKFLFQLYPNSYFIMEDVDKKYNKISKAFINVNGKKKYFKDNSQMIIGTQETIPLETRKYKNILCRISLHEFSNPNKMLSEMYRILRNEGKLIIMEQIPRYEGEIAKGCNKRLLPKEEIINLLTSNHFKLLSVDSTAHTDKKLGNGYIMHFSK
jgi:ubiquinone/menaquinone biosynthesis C-methylase UbiE